MVIFAHSCIKSLQCYIFSNESVLNFGIYVLHKRMNKLQLELIHDQFNVVSVNIF